MIVRAKLEAMISDLQGGFDWESTNQGHAYWKRVLNRLIDLRDNGYKGKDNV